MFSKFDGPMTPESKFPATSHQRGYPLEHIQTAVRLGYQLDQVRASALRYAGYPLDQVRALGHPAYMPYPRPLPGPSGYPTYLPDRTRVREFAGNPIRQTLESDERRAVSQIVSDIGILSACAQHYYQGTSC